MHLSLILLASLALTYLPLSLSYRDGARSESCYNMLVMHTNFLGRVVSPTECGDSCQYNLSVVGRVETEMGLNTLEYYLLDEGTPTTYQCGETYLLRLASTSAATFEGFMVEARESTGSFEEDFEEGSTIWGTWVTDPNNLYHAVECNRSLNSSEGPFENAATQNSPEDLTSIGLFWRAPPPPNSAEEYQQLPEQIRFWFVTVQQRLTYIYPVAGPILDRDCTIPPGSGSASASASASASGSGSAFGSGSAAGLDFVPFIPLSDEVCLQRHLDGASKPIYITGGMPFGNSVQNTAYVGTNGIISFGQPFYFWYPSLFPTRYAWTRNTYVVAPFWSDVDIRQDGRVCYTVHEKARGSASNELLRQISAFIVSQSGVSGETFNGIWMLVAQWEDVHMYPYTYATSYPQFYSKRERNRLQATSTYQAIVITDGIQAYAVFTYDCLRMETPGYYKYATIGFNARGEYYQNHPFSGLSIANNVACTGLQLNTLVYRLHLHADFVQQKRAQCLQMYKEDEDLFDNSYISILTSLAEPCPCSLRQAWRDRRFQIDWRNDLYCFYQRFSILGFSTQYCCYRFEFSVTWGSLVSTGLRTSSLLLYHPRFYPSLYMHFDREFRETCCGVANLCGLYQKRRPPNNCTGYNPPAWSWGSGDPHITTLDGRAYTFNGWGEYILANVTVFGSFQGRTSLVPGSTATQFSAFAFGNMYTRVEVNCMDASRMCETYYNGENITDNITNVNDTYSDLSVVIFRSTENSITTVFNFGVSINISVVAGIPNYVLTVPEQYRNQSRGLLGNFNGNDTDDFVFRNGTLLRNDASDFEIHQFGQSWQLQPGESLFQYPAGQTADDYAHPDHVPVFLQDIVNGADPQVVAACGSDSQCIFDAVQTGNTSIGIATMNTNQDNTVAYQEASNFPPRLVGPSSFLLNAGELSAYTFNASDDSGEQVQVNILGGLPANATLLQVNSTTYNFTWSLSDPNHVSNLTFYASDSSGAVGVLSPEIVVCACQNGGNCTTEGVLSAQNNVLIMNCICPSAWMGRFCETDVDGCDEISCYEGVACFDVPAPGEGVTCGPCPVGFTGDGQKCLDIDECGRSLDNCEQNCSNTVGSFECSCQPGYQPVAGAPNRCEDINECQLGIHDCQQLCTNTEGSFQCSCTEGFQANSDGTCTVPPQFRCEQNNCRSGCIRYGNGTQMCFCNRGYELDMDRQTCIDTNECERYSDICGPQQQCMNNDGGHSCVCVMGYEVDPSDPYGRTCQDIDECINAAVQGKLLCTGAQSRCVNQAGSYQCICPTGTFLTPTVLPDETVVTQCEVPVVSAEGRDNFLDAVLVGVAVTDFLNEGGIDDFIEITVNVTYWYCTSNGCGENDLISVNGTPSEMTLRVTRNSFSVVVDLDSVELDADGDLAFSFYIRVAVAGQMYILDKNTALAAVQSGAHLYVNRFGMNVSFVVANPDPPPVTEEPTTTNVPGLSTDAIAAIASAAAAALVTLVLLVLLAIACCCWKSKRNPRNKKALYTHSSDWPDQTTSNGRKTDEEKLPLTTYPAAQGPPTVSESPPTETEVEVMVNQGTVDVPTDPVPPTQI